MKIGLMGPFGYGNLGDAAIQDAMIQNIRKRVAAPEIFGYSFKPEDTFQRHGVISYPIMRDLAVDANFRRRIPHRWRNRRITRIYSRLFIRYPAEIQLTIQSFQNIKGLDTLIFSGGGQLDDYWGGPWQYPYTILKWTILARLRGSKVYFVSVGAGPIDAVLSRRFIRLALRLADYRSYRDESSKNYVLGIGFPATNDPVFPDLAYSLELPLGGKNTGDTPAGENENQPVKTIGVGPMAFFDPRVWPEHSEKIYRGYLAKLTEFVSRLISDEYQVILIPGGLSQDLRTIADLEHMLADSGMAGHQNISAPPIVNVDDLLQQIDRMDIVVASRLHSVILSHLRHKPVLAISYHNKIDVLMEDLAQSQYCLDIRKFSVEELESSFQQLESNRRLARQQIIDRVGRYREYLETQYDRLFV